MESELRRATEAFLQAKRLDRGASPLTLEAYERDMRALETWLVNEAAPLTPSAVQTEHLENFLASLSRAGGKATSVARKASTLRQFFKFCALEGVIEESPALRLGAPKIPSRLPKYLNHSEIEKLLAAL